MKLSKQTTAKILAKIGFEPEKQANGKIDFDPKLYVLVDVLCEVQTDIHNKTLDAIAMRLEKQFEAVKQLKQTSLAKHRRTLDPIKTIDPKKVALPYESKT